MKKIVIIVSQLNIGGAEKLSIELANNFAKKYCTSLFFLKTINVKYLTSLNSEINILFGTKSLTFKFFIKIIKRMIILRPDVILFQSRFPYVLLRILLSIFCSKSKVTLEIHGVYCKSIADKVIFYLTIFFLNIYKDRIIVSYSNQKLFLMKCYNIAFNSISIIPNGIEVNRLNFKRYLIPNSSVRLLFIGNYRIEKDFENLFKALIELEKNNTEWNLTIRSKIALSELKKYFDSSYDYIIHNKIKIIEEIDDVNQLYKTSDILLLSSLSEAFPMVILEALSHGLPVVATDVGGVSDILSTPPCGLIVPPRNPVELANSVKYLIKNPEIYSEFSANGLNKAYNIYRIEKVIDLYEQNLFY